MLYINFATNNNNKQKKKLSHYHLPVNLKIGPLSSHALPYILCSYALLTCFHNKI